jgi:hypothetical protein
MVEADRKAYIWELSGHLTPVPLDKYNPEQGIEVTLGGELINTSLKDKKYLLGKIVNSTGDPNRDLEIVDPEMQYSPTQRGQLRFRSNPGLFYLLEKTDKGFSLTGDLFAVTSSGTRRLPHKVTE